MLVPYHSSYRFSSASFTKIASFHCQWRFAPTSAKTRKTTTTFKWLLPKCELDPPPQPKGYFGAPFIAIQFKQILTQVKILIEAVFMWNIMIEIWQCQDFEIASIPGPPTPGWLPRYSQILRQRVVYLSECCLPPRTTRDNCTNNHLANRKPILRSVLKCEIFHN